MTDEIHLKIRATPQQSAAALLRAIDQSPGHGRRKSLAFALMMLGAVSLGCGMALIGAVPLGVGFAISVAALFGALIGMQIATRLNSAAMHRLQAADWRWQQGAAITLRPEGLVIEPSLIPWDAGAGSSRMPGVTVLHLGVIDRLALPDTDLPTGLTPEDIAAKIDGWRSPCPPF